MIPEAPPFVFVTCQVGAEGAVKEELARWRPSWRFAYSRPGFLTFKLPTEEGPDRDVPRRLVFARSWGVILGKVTGDNPAAMAAEVWQCAGDQGVDRLHVWPRDLAAAGHRDFQPAITPEALLVRDAIQQAAPSTLYDEAHREKLIETAERRDLILDCIIVAANEWWIGSHRAVRREQRWPGGLWQGETPETMISRAYCKISEALDWVAWPIKPGQRCVEIGCSPGGASQALLDRGLRVTGIDPAEVDPRIAAHPDFIHVRKRGADLRRTEYRDFQWLVADMNLVPAQTLATVREIVTHRSVNIRGLLINIKLTDWSQASQVPDYLAEVRSWGYPRVKASQLSNHRREICIAAIRPAPRHRPNRSRQQTSRTDAPTEAPTETPE